MGERGGRVANAVYCHVVMDGCLWLWTAPFKFSVLLKLDDFCIRIWTHDNPRVYILLICGESSQVGKEEACRDN